jgi:hypothetical protein
VKPYNLPPCLPDDVLAGGVEWDTPESVQQGTSTAGRVTTAGKAQDNPAAVASIARLGTVGRSTIKPKHQAKIQRRKLKYALRAGTQ